MNNGNRLMARKTPTTQIFTIREAGTNGFLGTYRALTADQATRKFWDDQAAAASTFRRSQPVRKFAVTAAVEQIEG
jgi:hypothetical protein